jgi:hypothetical protein
LFPVIHVRRRVSNPVVTLPENQTILQPLFVLPPSPNQKRELPRASQGGRYLPHQPHGEEAVMDVQGLQHADELLTAPFDGAGIKAERGGDVSAAISWVGWGSACRAGTAGCPRRRSCQGVPWRRTSHS